jgi:CHAT domain-containing protein
VAVAQSRVADVRASVLAYFVGIDFLYCTLHDHAGGEQVFRLASCCEILPKLEVLLEAFDGAHSPARRERAFAEFSRGWGRALLPPSEALESSDVLVVIPHAALHGIPLHAIEDGADARPLGATHGVTYVPTGTLFVRCVNRNPARRFDPAAWLFPRIGINGAPPPPRSCRAAAVDVRFHASGEYEALARLFLDHFQEKRWTEPDRTSVKPQRGTPSDAEALCIVCHGHYDSEFPGRSGLLLAIGRSEINIPIHFGQSFQFRDLPFRFFPTGVTVRPDYSPEILTVDELMVGASTDAQLIALVGCSTATGQTLSADDFHSLAHQFLKIGAAGVLASLWTLDFDFAKSWVPRFLRYWCDLRLPKALAFRESIRDELNEKAWPISEWAAPALFGDWL